MTDKHMGASLFDETAQITAPRRMLAGSALRAFASAIERGHVPAPESISAHRFNLPFAEFMHIAETGELPIAQLATRGGWIAAHQYAREEDSGIDIEMTFICPGARDDDQVQRVEAHNAAITQLQNNPCAGGCTNPEAHAEGAHDI